MNGLGYTAVRGEVWILFWFGYSRKSKHLDFLELNKLPEGTDGTSLYDWAKFIAAESEEELDRAAEQNQEVKKAVIKYRELTADERTRDLYERREKARRDIVSMMDDAKRGAVIEVAGNAKGMGMDIDTITKLTGLTRQEVELLS